MIKLYETKPISEILKMIVTVEMTRTNSKKECSMNCKKQTQFKAKIYPPKPFGEGGQTQTIVFLFVLIRG
jgi:hypothetical protein